MDDPEKPNAPRALVPFVHVASVPRSTAFYERLGFAVGNTFTPEGDPEPTWAWLRSDRAQLMVAQADEPVDPAKQALILYVYCDDVVAYRAELLARGVAAGEIRHPFYAPRGEFRVVDPDGYVLMVTHT